jgi:3-oxoacyl-(acyl-carrier-protein) synthase
MAPAVLFGGSESCLTAYTVSQLQALRIYSASANEYWPGQPLASDEGRDIPNTVTLGEGAGTAVLERYSGTVRLGDLELLGLGWQLERIPSATGVSLDGQGFEAAMRMATAGLSDSEPIDAVIAHAPGSARGDEAEVTAIERVFGAGMPVYSTKHVTGHTYGASGMVSLQLAYWLLSGGKWPGFPYRVRVNSRAPEAQIRRILINTAGFGGNTISVVVGLPS